MQTSTADLVLRTTLQADQHPAATYLARLSQGSRRSMRQALRTIAELLTTGRCDERTLDWSAVRYQHTTATRTALAERYSPATANKMLAALRGTLREAWRLGYMNAEDFHRATDVPPVKGSTLPTGRALSAGELRALFAVCSSDDTPAGARDAALFSLLYGAGLRRSEVVALDVADYDAESGAVVVRTGKGRKQRIGYVSVGGIKALGLWLRNRGDASGPLFLPIAKGGRVVERRMTDQAVFFILKKRATQAGVSSFSPHDLRRSFISHLLDAGADIATVQQLAGHSNIQTTSRYDRRGERSKRKAAQLLHVPY